MSITAIVVATALLGVIVVLSVAALNRVVTIADIDLNAEE